MQKDRHMTILSFSRNDAGKINRWGFALLAAGILAAGRPANAQGLPQGFPVQIPGLPKRTQGPMVPPAYRPPAGMCRIWIEGVPPGQQPAPTDCVTAVRNKPVNGSVIFGESPKRDNEKPKKGKSKKDSADAPDQ